MQIDKHLKCLLEVRTVKLQKREKCASACVGIKPLKTGN